MAEPNLSMHREGNEGLGGLGSEGPGKVRQQGREPSWGCHPMRLHTHQGVEPGRQWCHVNTFKEDSIPRDQGYSPPCDLTYLGIRRRWGGDFPGGTLVKNPSANAGHMGSVPGWERTHMPQSS